MRPFVYLRTACSDAASEVACNAALPSDPAASFTVPRLAPGFYYLWADGTGTSAGAFDLRVALSAPPPRPANDTCRAAASLDLTTGSASVTTTTADATPDYAASCGTSSYPANGADLVYVFTLDANAVVNATLTPPTGSTLKPVLSLRRDCADVATEVSCKYTSSTATAVAVTNALGPGTYYLIAGGVGATSGDFTLALTATPMATPGDTCSNAQPLTWNGEVGTATGDTTNATGDDNAGCSPSSSSADVVYSFTTSATKTVAIELTPSSATSIKALVSLRSSCDDRSSELGCMLNTTANQAARLTLNRVPAGTYYVWVDGYSTTRGGFTLTVTLSAPVAAPANDTCAGAIPVPLTTVDGPDTVSGTVAVDTTNAMNDYLGSCGATTAPLRGNDLVYAITPATDAMVSATITLSSTTAGYRAAAYLRSTCASDAAVDELACVLGNLNQNLSLAAVPLKGGVTYYLIVDGGGNVLVSGQLKVSARSSVSTGDACFNAVPIALDTTGHGATTGDTMPWSSSGMGSCDTTKTGPDGVFYFVLPDERDVTVRVSPTNTSMRPVAYLRTTCEDAATELGCHTPKTNSAASLSFVTLPAATYYLWVDSYQTYFGPFAVDITTTTPPPVANDACTGALPIDVDPMTGKGSVQGATTYAHDSGGAICGGTTERDVVYSFVTSRAKKAVVRATRDGLTPSFRPVVYLRRGCSSTAAVDQFGCAAEAGGAATAVVNSLPAGTWYVWVDGASGTAGRFTLDVTLDTPVVGPANEACHSLVVLNFSGNSATASGTTLLAQSDADGTCSEPGAPDVVYQLTLPSARRVTATVAPTDATFQPAVYLRTSCYGTPTSGELGCNAATSAGASAQLEVGHVDAGTYYLWVDGKGSYLSAGPFTLDVQLGTPTPP